MPPKSRPAKSPASFALPPSSFMARPMMVTGFINAKAMPQTLSCRTPMSMLLRAVDIKLSGYRVGAELNLSRGQFRHQIIDDIAFARQLARFQHQAAHGFHGQAFRGLVA